MVLSWFVSVIGRLISFMIDCLVDWLIDCLVDWLIDWLIDRLCLSAVLKQYLRELPEPLMTFDLYNEWVDALKAWARLSMFLASFFIFAVRNICVNVYPKVTQIFRQTFYHWLKGRMMDWLVLSVCVWFSPPEQKVSVLSNVIPRMPRAYKVNLQWAFASWFFVYYLHKDFHCFQVFC